MWICLFEGLDEFVAVNGLAEHRTPPMRFTAASTSGPEPETAMIAASENEARNALINPGPST